MSEKAKKNAGNMRYAGKVCLSGNGEERRSGEPPLGRSAGLLNNKQQFFILLGRNNTAIYPTSFNRQKNKDVLGRESTGFNQLLVAATLSDCCEFLLQHCAELKTKQLLGLVVSRLANS